MADRNDGIREKRCRPGAGDANCRPFLDTDALVEDAAGLAIVEVFEEEGEAGFRVRESEAIRIAAAASPKPWSLPAGEPCSWRTTSGQ